MELPEIEPAVILAALYNHARAAGYSFLSPSYDPLKKMTVEEAREILKRQTSFDYFEGRLLKISFHGNSVDTHLYDRDYGQGAAEYAILDALTTPRGK